MYIDRISLNNFKVYKGSNTIDLSISPGKNVSIITGNNGFGKTSLLTSLVWCLYGKLMSDVDERYKKEIYECGGYKNYCNRLINRITLDESETESKLIETKLGSSDEAERQGLRQRHQNLYSFSVSIRFKKIFIPAIPCNDLELIRTYNVKSQTETLAVYIDGQPNELTKEVGPEIFINDFILRKEIAKFFFFDAEKIVELAEIRSIEDRRSLGKAYGEVLGIKKYLDLKGDLENLRLRLSKKNSSAADREKLEKLGKLFGQNSKMIEHHSSIVHEKEEELILKRFASDKFQEQLIREGSSITVEELKDFRQMKEHLQEESLRLKNRMKEMMELAPLALVASKMESIRNQIETEQEQKDKKNNVSLLKRKANALKKAITVEGLISGDRKREELFLLIENTLLPQGVIVPKPLLDFTSEQENRFLAVYDNLQNAFSKNFKALTAELKKQQTSVAIINRKLFDGESKENDPVIKVIRTNKNQLDTEIKKQEAECIDIKAKIISLQNEQNNLSLQVSELSKRVKVEDIDKAKDEVAARLIGELETFIYKLKNQKKHSLEEKILQELHVLMHKQNFVQKVKVLIEGDMIDIELYDADQRQIDKDSLSKGEQQLYATALLKALVEESNIRFPVFIDSPLQKFDKEHARNIIEDFYPNVSSQVILFPLLEKELNESEFQLLYPKVTDCYLIKQKAQYESGFESVNPAKLYETYNNTIQHVYGN
ncbi:MAG: AAA family ATPase [Chitinophagaceae bacterium]|nr:AAA family ATPase [Chitinophagaceae bacterium]